MTAAEHVPIDTARGGEPAQAGPTPRVDVVAGAGDLPRVDVAASHGAPGCRASAVGPFRDAIEGRGPTPAGSHDQPQTMCPAFGSLRVGLRMRRTATVLCGSACCVYGLSFTSHFYGARRTIGYVPFSSETLVTGKLFEDIRDAVHQLADPANYDAIIVTNLCVPTAAGVPLRLLPKQINGVRIIGVDVPGFGTGTHAEAKDVLGAAMLNRARLEAEQGPVQAPRGGRSDRPTVTLIGEMFPADPINIGMLLAPLGLAAGPMVPTREWRELYAALDCGVVAAIHPIYTAVLREFEVAGRTIVGSAPVGYEGTAAWLDAIGEAYGVGKPTVDAAKAKLLPPIKAALANAQIKGRIIMFGYEGSELLVARLLVESGAEVPYVGTACPRTPWSEADRAWLESKGVRVQFRATHEHDLQAIVDFKPDLAIGTTPMVQKAKELAIPSIYFTNLISTLPMFGAAGVGQLAKLMNAAIGNKARFDRMSAFFAGVGEAEVDERPAFREAYQRRLAAQARQRKAEEIG